MATLNVRVSTAETEFNMKLKRDSTAKNLFDTIVATTGIRETWFFGLNYTDTSDEEAWLLSEKKIVKQDVRTESAGAPLKFQFKVMYYPENVETEVIQDLTLRLLFRQVRAQILLEQLYCPADKAVLLASFAVQAKFGDYDVDAENQGQGYLANENLLPKKIFAQHKLSSEEWEEKISQFHQQHRGLSKEEAMLEYLKITQELESFGVTYFEVVNKQGHDALLGVDALGINFYGLQDKLTPRVSFPWSEIAKVSYKKDMFKIRFTDRKTPLHTVKGKNARTAMKIFYMATGTHDMYRRRRMPDPLDVQQMKGQKELEQKQREKERALLKREMLAREKIAQLHSEMEAKYRALQNDMEQRQKELEESRENIERLRKQLEETQAARDSFEKQQEELRALLAKLESERNLEEEERQKLADDIAKKEQEIEAVRQEVEAKEEERRRLQQEMEEAQNKMELSAKAMEEVVTSPPPKPFVNGFSEDSTSDVPKIVVDSAEDDAEKREELMKELREDLNETHLEGTETDEDKLYQKNLSEGRDKYRTLTEVRKGNTTRRIDMFENM